MRTNIGFALSILLLFSLVTDTIASHYDILRPANPYRHLDVKKISPQERKSWAKEHRSDYSLSGLSGCSGIIDTVTWRSKDEEDINF